MEEGGSFTLVLETFAWVESQTSLGPFLPLRSFQRVSGASKFRKAGQCWVSGGGGSGARQEYS